MLKNLMPLDGLRQSRVIGSAPTGVLGRSVGGGRSGAVDVLRLLMATFVMLNHSCVFGRMVGGVVGMAVPVFLMLSGYFFYTEDAGAERRRCLRQLKKICKLTVFSYAFYILWHLLWNLSHSQPLLFDWSTLYTGTNLFAPHLWYLHAYLLMLVLVYAMHRLGFCLDRVRCRWLLLYAAVSYLLYHVDGVPSLVVNVFFYSLGFFSIGMVLRRMTVKVRFCVVFVLLALSLCGCIVNARLNVDTEGYPLVMVLASAMAVQTAVSVHVDASSVLARMGRDLSLHIYIMHWAVLNVLNTSIYTSGCSSMLLYTKPVLLVGSSILVAYVFSKRSSLGIGSRKDPQVRS